MQLLQEETVFAVQKDELEQDGVWDVRWEHCWYLSIP